jgi:photosystem II stability/assembly factor-like uncharacterized protein
MARTLLVIIISAIFLSACSRSDTPEPYFLPTSQPVLTADAVITPSGIDPTNTPSQAYTGSTSDTEPLPTQSEDGRGIGTISELPYDVDCVSSTLGRSTADAIIYGGSSASSNQIQRIEPCLVVADHDNLDGQDNRGNNGYNQPSPTQSEDGDAIASIGGLTYSVACVSDTLGSATTDTIIYGGSTASSNQIQRIEPCLFVADQDNRDGQDNWGNHGDNQPYPDTDQQRILADWGPSETDNCFGTDKDQFGFPIGPQCNLILPQLPPGVIRATLRSVDLPSPGYGNAVSSCQTFQNGECSELHWELTSDLRAGEFVQIRISQTDPNVMYAGVDSNDMTIYRSTDAGATWQLVHVTGHAAGLAISPVDSQTVLYTNLEAPVQLSLDGGTSWDPVVGGEPGGVNYNKPFTAIAFSNDQSSIVYTAALRGDSRGGIWPAEPSDIYKSTDSGQNWMHVGTCGTCSSVQTIVVKKGDPNFVWVAADGGLQYSQDGGQTWSGNVIPYLQQVSDQTGGDVYATMPKVIGLAVHPDSPGTMLVASSEFGLFRSTDYGISWKHSNDGLKTSKLHQVHFAPSNANVAYLTTHDGVYRSDDGGRTWNARTNNLPYTFVSPIAIHPTNPDIVFVGTTSEIYTIHPEHQTKGFHEGHGLYRSVDGGRNWTQSDTGITEAKLAQIGTHPLLPFNVWVGGESGRGNLLSPDGGESWLFSPSTTAHYPMVYAFSYENPSVMYMTGWLKTGELAASTDGGASWYTLTHKLEAGLSPLTRDLGLRTLGPSDFHIHGVAVAPSDPNTIYVGSVHDTVYPNLTFNLDGAHIWKSSDGGQTFPEMSNGFPIATKTAINSIIVHPTNPDIAYAMTSLHETDTAIGVYKTVDGAQVWFPVNNGLDVFTNDLQIDPLDPDILYAAAESGIYKTTDAARTWRKASTGLAKGPVIDMAIDPLNPLVLYAITPDDIYRTRDGGDHWYSVNLGIPLLESSSAVLSAQERLTEEFRLDRTKTAHSMYGGTFAQDRTLEIDATGTIIVVAVKTNRDDNYKLEERMLYRSVVGPLVQTSYEFLVNNSTISVSSQSNIYDMQYDSNHNRITFTAAGPTETSSKTTVSIPKDLISGDFLVTIDGKALGSTTANGHTTFEYVHAGASTIEIKVQ